MRMAQCWEAGHVIEKQADSSAQMSNLQAELKFNKNNLARQATKLFESRITSPVS